MNRLLPGGCSMRAWVPERKDVWVVHRPGGKQFVGEGMFWDANARKRLQSKGDSCAERELNKCFFHGVAGIFQ